MQNIINQALLQQQQPQQSPGALPQPGAPKGLPPAEQQPQANQFLDKFTDIINQKLTGMNSILSEFIKVN